MQLVGLNGSTFPCLRIFKSFQHKIFTVTERAFWDKKGISFQICMSVKNTSGFFLLCWIFWFGFVVVCLFFLLGMRNVSCFLCSSLIIT